MVCVICVLGLFIFYSALRQGGMMALGRKSKKSWFMLILPFLLLLKLLEALNFVIFSIFVLTFPSPVYKWQLVELSFSYINYIQYIQYI